jgi:hypothetical protein
MVVPVQAGNAVVQGQQETTAAAVAAGKRIGPQQEFVSGDAYMSFNSFKSYGEKFAQQSGTWRNVEFAYVGLKIVINGQVHYGWARIKFPYVGAITYPTIYGYAYESTPNQPIDAGQTSGTSEEAAKTPAASLGMLAAGASGVNVWRGQN